MAGTSEDDCKRSGPERSHEDHRRAGHIDGALLDAAESVDQDRHGGAGRTPLQLEDAPDGSLAEYRCREAVEGVCRKSDYTASSENIGGCLYLGLQVLVLGWKGR